MSERHPAGHGPAPFGALRPLSLLSEAHRGLSLLLLALGALPCLARSTDDSDKTPHRQATDEGSWFRDVGYSATSTNSFWLSL